MIRQILSKIRLIPIYFFINLRRFICERKISKIENNELLRNGFIKFHSKNGKKITNYLSEVINEPEKAENSKLGVFKILNKNNFGVKTIVVDASSDFLHEFVFVDEILEKLRNYYGKEFYLRNNPTIEFNYDNEVSDAQFFHLDYCAKQTSVMINLNEINISSTHMEYIKKTNKHYRLSIPNRESQKEINKVREISKKNDIAKTIGNVGDVSIFDAGSGYHRQVGGGKRVMLHLNFTENLAHTGWKKNWRPEELEYWFSNNKNNLEKNLFNLITKKFKKSFLTPNIYCQK
tara:strand:- start:59 stop:928 length:870 start_codon:yes stop_codon:yes gene_type:complete